MSFFSKVYKSPGKGTYLSNKKNIPTERKVYKFGGIRRYCRHLLWRLRRYLDSLSNRQRKKILIIACVVYVVCALYMVSVWFIPHKDTIRTETILTPSDQDLPDEPSPEECLPDPTGALRA